MKKISSLITQLLNYSITFFFFSPGLTSLGLVFFIFPASANAQSFSLSITPPLLEIVSQPDKTLNLTYKITNQADKDMAVTPEIFPFRAKDEQGDLELILNKAAFDKSRNWFSLQNPGRQLAAPFLLKAGQTENLLLKIRIPGDALQKDYYYSLVIRQVPPLLPAGQTRVVNLGAVASNLLLSVSPSSLMTPDLTISQFSLTTPPLFLDLIDSNDEISFKAIIKNNGLYYTKTGGKILIKDNRGRIVRELALLPQNILAFSSRSAVCTPSAACILSPQLTLGRFQAVLTVNGQEKSFYFNVLPIKTLAISLVCLFALLLFWKLFKFSRKISRSKKNK